ncbi:cytochrome P450 4c3-like [Dermacentor silvarum]|uniref:cytochrome P450 4c3-like n=1 Tax=Dermacentor silvarum TaxID=543639 RepID=UPI001899B7C8|nr:cytochrome P450 4c3-like [Dermacentor silvarum]
MAELSASSIGQVLLTVSWYQVASAIAGITALSLTSMVLVLGLLLWTARKVHLKTVKQLNDLPQFRQQFPFQFLWTLKKACNPPDSPVAFSSMLFAAVSGFHATFQKHGRYLVYVGFTPFLIIYKDEYVEEVLSSNKILTKGREYNLLHNWLGTGLLTSAGEKWRTRRRLLTPSFHFRILEDFMPTINSESMVLSNKLAMLSRENKTFDVVPLVTLCTLDIICETIMGTTINAQCNEDSPYVAAVNRMGELFVERLMKPLYTVDFIYKLTPAGREFQRCLQILHSFTHKVIAERKQELRKEIESGIMSLEDTQSDVRRNKTRPFMDILLLEHFKSNITEEGIREEVDTFMFEGHDTTAMGISWALFLVGHYQAQQRLIHEELDSIFGEDRERHVTKEDLKQMKYLECVLKESQRIYPSVPMITRECVEPFTIGGKTLPKGTLVQIANYFLHRDPKVFPKPEEFHPERFLPENCRGRHPYAYVPFSAGPRNCIGQKFALAEEKIVVANILRRFKIESLDHRDQVALAFEMVLRPRSGLRIKFTPR